MPASSLKIGSTTLSSGTGNTSKGLLIVVHARQPRTLEAGKRLMQRQRSPSGNQGCGEQQRKRVSVLEAANPANTRRVRHRHVDAREGELVRRWTRRSGLVHRKEEACRLFSSRDGDGDRARVIESGSRLRVLSCYDDTDSGAYYDILDM